MINKSKLFSFSGLMLILAMTGPAIAQVNANVVYINGIQNTLEDAQHTKNKIQVMLNASVNHTGIAKKGFLVSLVWNPIGWYGTKDGNFDLAQDKMELFLLKTAEEKFAPDFKKIMVPFNASKAIDKEAATRVNAYLEDMTPGDNSLETDNKITDEEMKNTKTAAMSLAGRVKTLRSAIVVAHSQGNLLANLAYAKLASTFGNDLSKIMRVVNVANTSEFSVNNLNFTHMGDAALFSAATTAISGDQSLETMPSRGLNWTRSNPPFSDKGADKFTIAPATFDVPTSEILPEQGWIDKDLDHSIVETYLSEATVPVINTQGVAFTSLKERFVDRFEDFIYAAAGSICFENLNCVAPPPITKRYTITDLGQWQPTAINDVCQIVGYVYDPSTSQSRAMLWSGGVFTPLGPPDVISSQATDINNSGQAAGWAQILLASQGNPIHAVKFTGSAMTDLDTFDGNSSQAFGINNSGQVVGSAQGYVSYGGNLVFSPGTAFITSAGVMVDIGTATANRSVPAWLGVNSFLTGNLATKINNNGQVIGNTHLMNGNGFMSSFIYDPNSSDPYTIISPLLSPSSSERLSYASEFIYSTDINDLGQVVGWTYSSYLYRAFLYQNGAMIDLPVAARQAFAINNNGQIIGYGEGRSGNTGNYQAGMFLYENGNMKFWDELLPENSGWSISAATGAFDINNKGQIIGVGYFNGEQRAFLLTPDTSVPVP